MINKYVNKSKIKDAIIGEEFVLAQVGFIDKKLEEGAYCFLKKEKKELKTDDFVYLNDASILMHGKEFYKVNVRKLNSSISPFENKISIQPIKKGKLEKEIALGEIEHKKFKFVGFFNNFIK